MPARHFSQTPPDRANDLFDRILATSDGAAKTRERLLSELKDELALLASLQEQHLFPILQRHGMIDLLQAATNDNNETTALLEELESMPKNGSAFLDKVAELRRAFQRHIRDDRKELLPAVLQVLSDEEAQAVAEQVEDEISNIETMKQAAPASLVSQNSAMRAGTDAVDDAMRMSTDSVHTVAVGVQDLSWECLRMSQKRLETNLDGWSRLAQCRSPQDLARAQVSLLQDNLEQTLNNGFRLASLAMQLAEKAAWHRTQENARLQQR